MVMRVMNWLRQLGARPRHPGADIPSALWEPLLVQHPFLAALTPAEQQLLRELCSHFLAQKEFHGAHGLVITDTMALAVAAQACLPLLHLGAGVQPLSWYDDFVGIVMHPGPALARREVMDETGVVHTYDEELAGEAMEHGPVMLSWPDVQDAPASAEQGYNVVIHEFIHKMDLRDGAPDGCPPLPPGFMGARTAQQARTLWLGVLEPAWQDFRERVILAERFGQPPTWLDPYGAQGLDEFFAVACEAYFVNRRRMAEEFPTLLPLFDAFFKPGAVRRS